MYRGGKNLGSNFFKCGQRHLNRILRLFEKKKFFVNNSQQNLNLEKITLQFCSCVLSLSSCRASFSTCVDAVGKLSLSSLAPNKGIWVSATGVTACRVYTSCTLKRKLFDPRPCHERPDFAPHII